MLQAVVQSIVPITPVGRAAVFVLIAYWAWQVVGYVFPASYWFSVDKVAVSGVAYEGEEVQLSVIRDITRPFRGEYSVVVENLDSREIECDGFADLDYDPSRNLPKPLTLSWWVGDPCILPAGEYKMITEWEVKGTPFDAFDKDVKIDTHFSVLPAPEPVASVGDQLEQQQTLIEDLKTQIETLAQEVLR